MEAISSTIYDLVMLTFTFQPENNTCIIFMVWRRLITESLIIKTNGMFKVSLGNQNVATNKHTDENMYTKYMYGFRYQLVGINKIPSNLNGRFKIFLKLSKYWMILFFIYMYLIFIVI